VGKDEQSLFPSADKAADTRNVYKVASYCTQCRWHIDVVVDSRDNGAEARSCRKGDAEFILHHFQFQGDSAANGSVGLGSQVAPRTYTFTCSAPRCPVKVHVHMKPPHLSDQDIETLTNQARLRKRWEDAKRIAGDRADATMARRVDGPDFLNTYLQDSLNPVKGKTRIPLFNKKFLKTFGRDCDAILQRLGFTTTLEDENDSESQVWYLPQPGEAQDPLERTLRNTIEDVRCELNTIILSIPANERDRARHAPSFPTPSRAHIERALACDGCM
jgi:ubiquitin carboxyl-terminal hydrolase 25/28